MGIYIVKKDDSYLAHYGVKGMQWGVRNYQNYDGSYTAQGRSRYGIDSRRMSNNITDATLRGRSYRSGAQKNASNNSSTGERKRMSPETKKKIAIAAVGVLAAAAVTAGVVVAAKNPEATKNIINKIGTSTVSGIGKAGSAVKSTVNKMSERSNARALEKYRNAMKTGDLAKASKIVSSGKLAKSSKIVSKMGNDKFKEKWVARNWNRLKADPVAVNNMKGTIKTMDNGLKMLNESKGLYEVGSKMGNIAKGMSKFNKIAGTATGIVTAAGTVTGALVSGKKIINDLNNLYTTQNLPLVKDYLNSPNGQKTNTAISRIKDQIFGTKVEDLEKEKQ